MNSHLSIINKINTHSTNTDFVYDYAATSLMFKLSSLFENSVTKVGGAETSKFGPIPQFGDFRSTKRMHDVSVRSIAIRS